jgi:hypothetical protein
MTFRELLSAVSDKVAAVYAASEIPFDEVSKELSKAGVTVPRVKAIFLVSVDSGKPDLADLNIEVLPRPHRTAMPWGFTISFTAGSDVGKLALVFDAAIYDPSKVSAFSDQLCRFCGAIARHPARPLAELLAESGVVWNVGRIADRRLRFPAIGWHLARLRRKIKARVKLLTL